MDNTVDYNKPYSFYLKEIEVGLIIDFKTIVKKISAHYLRLFELNEKVKKITFCEFQSFEKSILVTAQVKPAAHEAFFSTRFWDQTILFPIWRPVGLEMTSLLAVFLASLLDLKNRACSIFRLGPGMLLGGSKQTKIIKISLVCNGL